MFIFTTAMLPHRSLKIDVQLSLAMTLDKISLRKKMLKSYFLNLSVLGFPALIALMCRRESLPFLTPTCNKTTLCGTGSSHWMDGSSRPGQMMLHSHGM